MSAADAVSAGRFAPSPSGALHLGNLRTALVAWLFARSTGRRFLLRFEDLDTARVRPGALEQQVSDLRALGLDWDAPVERQSDRLAHYADALSRLDSMGLVYECFCTRRDIASAPSAPHAPAGAYPGTCRNLSPAERRTLSRTRAAALRLRAGVLPAASAAPAPSSLPPVFAVEDELLGRIEAPVDDFVLRRGDGTFAYNLAVVVDDAAFGIDQVVRGDDLASSAPRQAYLASILGLPVPRYAHVPLVLNAAGQRLAKRDGAVTLADRMARGESATEVARVLATSLGLRVPEHADVEPAGTSKYADVEPAGTSKYAGSASELLAGVLAVFAPSGLRREPWVFSE